MGRRDSIAKLGGVRFSRRINSRFGEASKMLWSSVMDGQHSGLRPRTERWTRFWQEFHFMATQSRAKWRTKEISMSRVSGDDLDGTLRERCVMVVGSVGPMLVNKRSMSSEKRKTSMQRRRFICRRGYLSSTSTAKQILWRVAPPLTGQGTHPQSGNRRGQCAAKAYWSSMISGATSSRPASKRGGVWACGGRTARRRRCRIFVPIFPPGDKRWAAARSTCFALKTTLRRAASPRLAAYYGCRLFQ